VAFHSKMGGMHNGLGPSVVHCAQVQNHSIGFVALHSKMGGMDSGLGHIFWEWWNM
jgi:hypothetical protein